MLGICLGCQPVPLVLQPPVAPSSSAHALGAPPPISVSTRASTADGDLVLQAPRNDHHALLLVRDYFRAIGTESLPAMTRLLTLKAKIRTSAGGRPSGLIQHWQSRFKKLDYRALAGNEAAQLSRLQLYRSDELAKLSPPRSFALTPKGTELLIYLPVATTHAAAQGSNKIQRLMGPDMTFLLVTDGPGFKIREVYEDFRVP